MSAFVDTTILIRHLTGNPTEMAARAMAYLEAETELLLADLVAAEMVHAPESFYEAPRHRVAEALRSCVAFDCIVCVDCALLLRAVEVYETDRIDFPDAAYLVACAESTGVSADRLAQSFTGSCPHRPAGSNHQPHVTRPTLLVTGTTVTTPIPSRPTTALARSLLTKTAGCLCSPTSATETSWPHRARSNKPDIRHTEAATGT